MLIESRNGSSPPSQGEDALVLDRVKGESLCDSSA